MPRQKRAPVPPRFQPMIASFDLALEAAPRSANTRRIYTDAAGWLAATLAAEVEDWAEVTDLHLRQFFAELARAGYAKAYCNNIGRALQAFFKWLALEEDLSNPFAGGRVQVPEPPRLDESVVPLLEVEVLAQLMRNSEAGRDLASRRDAALLRLFCATGCRLAELAGIRLDDLDIGRREVTVTGKGGRMRTVRFDNKTALAVDRYLRVRAKHRAASSPHLWLGLRQADGISARGLYRVVRRRGQDIGVEVHPHLFRHSFCHRWLDGGGAEGDLMELMGWESPEMLRYYGRSARGARARRAYDRVDLMGGA